MRGPHNIFRLIRTGATFERTGGDECNPQGLSSARSACAWPRKFLVGHFNGWVTRVIPQCHLSPGRLTALGPGLYQIRANLSTRPDVVGDELAAQLRVLQDKLPPFPIEEAQRMIEAELERPLTSIFQDFSAPCCRRLYCSGPPSKVSLQMVQMSP
jgi:ubiquinone biosynthesis protein